MKKRILLIAVFIFGIIIIPVIVDWCIIGNKFTSNVSNEDWIAFLGGYIGGVFTLAGVLLTLHYYRTQEKRINDDNCRKQVASLYWFLRFKIHTIDNREKYWIVKSRYREAIVAALLEHGANIEELNNLDLCYILNYWVPAHFNCYDVIHEKINQVLTKRVAFEEVDDSAFFQLFGHKPTKYSLLDKRERNKYKKIEIERA